ncbi:ComF family protein [Duganella sp. BJB1802]|uniref:ComF family protein n=1 Tax=Duganella sp. BJB1802 TaxID=2744575 RepID=UPI0015941207|nr:ComF family protein [Duganella sp. BJB1802]NVD70550.1 ComF family protein [Duganella sp. BJB1802]
MNTHLREVQGAFDAGFVLDKHTIRSIPLGPNEQGHMQFNTLRTEVGEALYQLKYRHDHSQALALAKTLYNTVGPRLPVVIDIIIPMPPSTVRAVQPVSVVVAQLAQLMRAPVLDLVRRQPGGRKLKDLHTREEKDAELSGKFSLHGAVSGPGSYNVLLVDDLYDSGATADAVTTVLRNDPKIKGVYYVALTWK